jgi:phosphatidylglycerol lysyltransferase
VTRLARLLPPVLGVVVFVGAAAVLRRELHAYHYAEVIAALEAIPAGRIALALVLTAASYAVLTGYDALALRYVGARLAYARVALASFVGYALSHNLGAALLSGGAVRYRLYSSWGLTALDVGRIVLFDALTFWIGFLGVLGGMLAAGELPVALRTHLSPAATRALGVAALGFVAAYAGLCVRRREPIRWREMELRLPVPRLAAAQIGIAVLDWVLAASVLFALLPAGTVPFVAFVPVFLLAQIAGVASTVPAGLGVFETGMLVLLGATASTPAVIGSLVAYRIAYYLVPLVAAVLLLAAYEVAARRSAMGRVGRALGRWAPGVVPHALATATFLAGVVLLVSGSTPAVGERLAWLRSAVPLPLLELSHFTGSLAGVGLLLLARGLQRRLDAAWMLAAVLLGVGVVASLLKGLDWEEALFLSLVLASLVGCRREFDRRAALLDAPLSAPWTVAMLLVVVGVGCLLLVVYRHVEYTNDLWWRFEFEGDAPRSLRAAVGAAVLLATFGVSRLLRAAPPEAVPPTPADRERVAAIVAGSPDAAAHLALLGDKSFLMSESGRAFVMYAVSRRAWVALGDPVGPPEEARELAWRFRELGDRHGGLTVFYEVGTQHLPVYLDLGLSLLKLGEEARVALAGFSLEGHGRKALRAAHRHAEREGCHFEIVPAGGVGPLLDELRGVSDAWLAERSMREKGFSLGFFAPDYIRGSPVAVVRREGRITAFANLWFGAEHEELSVDLMRHLPDGPTGLMDYLFVELMLWGRREGYRWFNFGMAPLAGLEDRALAPLWHRAGAFVFRHGQHFYGFEGLRQYKQKFEPEWTPRYLACPGGLALPEVLVSITALVSTSRVPGT